MRVVNAPDLHSWWDEGLERDELIKHCQQVVELREMVEVRKTIALLVSETVAGRMGTDFIPFSERS